MQNGEAVRATMTLSGFATTQSRACTGKSIMEPYEGVRFSLSSSLLCHALAFGSALAFGAALAVAFGSGLAFAFASQSSEA
eukprot:252976-Amphidinium_carterae.1